MRPDTRKAVIQEAISVLRERRKTQLYEDIVTHLLVEVPDASPRGVETILRALHKSKRILIKESKGGTVWVRILG